MILGDTKTISGGLIAYDEKLKLFENCLVKWRISEKSLANTQMFLGLQIKVFSKTPNILQTGIVKTYPNITYFDIKDDIPQYLSHIKCTVLFNEIFPRHIKFIGIDGNPDFVVYFYASHSQYYKEALGEQIANVNFSGTPMFLDLSGKLELVCFASNTLGKRYTRISTVQHLPL